MNGSVVMALLVWISFGSLCYMVGRIAMSLLTKRTQELMQPIFGLSAPVTGLALMAIQLWLLGVMGVGWNRLSLVLPWLLVAIMNRKNFVLLIRADLGHLRPLPKQFKDLTLLEQIGVAGIVGIIGINVVWSITQPLVSWDAVAMWMYKAKLYFNNHAVVFADYKNTQYLLKITSGTIGGIASDLGRHGDYPPLYPLMIDALYIWRGSVSELLGKSLNGLFAASFVGVLWQLQKSRLPRQYSLVILLSFITVPLAATAFTTGYLGYADYTVGICMGLSGVFLVDYVARRQATSVYMALFMAFCAAMVKNEGQPFFMVILLVVSALLLTVKLKRKTSWRPLVPIFVWAAFLVSGMLAWKVMVDQHHVPSEFFGTSLRSQLGQLLPKAKVVFRYVAHFMFGSSTALLVLILSLLSMGIAIAGKNRSLLLVWVLVCLQFASYMVIYLISPRDLNWHLATSFDRLVVQLCPLMFVAFGLTIVAVEPRGG